MQTLKSNHHNGFPVVDPGPVPLLQPKSTFAGLILRSELSILLNHPEVFRSAKPTPRFPSALSAQQRDGSGTAPGSTGSGASWVSLGSRRTTTAYECMSGEWPWVGCGAD